MHPYFHKSTYITEYFSIKFGNYLKTAVSRQKELGRLLYQSNRPNVGIMCRFNRMPQMGCISLLGGVHFAFPRVQMGCNPKTGWGANLGGGVQIFTPVGADISGRRL